MIVLWYHHFLLPLLSSYRLLSIASNRRMVLRPWIVLQPYLRKLARSSFPRAELLISSLYHWTKHSQNIISRVILYLKDARQGKSKTTRQKALLNTDLTRHATPSFHALPLPVCNKPGLHVFLFTHSLFPKHPINISTESNGKEGMERSKGPKNLNRNFDPLSSDRWHKTSDSGPMTLRQSKSENPTTNLTV